MCQETALEDVVGLVFWCSVAYVILLFGSEKRLFIVYKFIF